MPTAPPAETNEARLVDIATAHVRKFGHARTTVVGGRFLIAVLALAIVIHILHGWFDVGALLVYLAATWAVIASASSSHEN